MSEWTLISRDGRKRYTMMLADAPLTIGRASRADVVIDDAQVSRHHARIETRDAHPWILDLGSKNGTWLNGAQLEASAVELCDGDELRLGQLALRVQSGDDRTLSVAERRTAETVTVLFTDLEGHTALFEELGTDAAFELVTQHIDAMKRAVSLQDGIVVKTQGDGLIATFTSVRNAVDCALAIQRWSNAGEGDRRVPVRIGINTGDAIRLDEDLLGLAVIKAARVMAHAAGGEILIAEVSRLLLGPTLDLTISSRGWFTLKGVAQPEQLFLIQQQE
jgi:class 3 adenylate cyclase